jgi:murein DD-endopeptidase MepM/ murein hydrolase activator NlpD
MVRCVARILFFCFTLSVGMSAAFAAEQSVISAAKLVAPFEGGLKYPFTQNESMDCGRWGKSSQDYPYFGASRDRNTRRHAGVDLYPRGGAGTTVKAVADGVVLKISPFYRRANGEVTWGILVDHHDFVVNYAELKKPGVKVSSVIRQGQVLGRVSGTRQLHFELYAKGTGEWLRWHDTQPESLIDPTEIMLELLTVRRPL